MATKNTLISLFLVLCVQIVCIADENLSDVQLRTLKTATVLIQCKVPHGVVSGSGFVVRHEGQKVWIATNAHVALPDGQEPLHTDVIFNSGTNNELTLPASLAATAGSRDLALLRVESDHLPPPLSLGSSSTLRETQSVLVLGFPFGDILASSERHSAITIGKVLVSSLRRDDFGVISAIQVDGAMNPGNSGGPVVTADSKVIGISVATIRGSGLGFVLPVEELRDFLSGNPINLKHEQLPCRKGEAKVTFIVSYVDPFEKITSISALIVPVSQIKNLPQAGSSSNDTPPISASARECTLSIDRSTPGTATGTLSMVGPSDALRADYYVQIRTSSQGSSPRNSGITRIPLDFTGSGTKLDGSRFEGGPASNTATQPQDPDPADVGPHHRGGKIAGSPAPFDPGAAALPTQINELTVETPLPKLATQVEVAGDGRYLVIGQQDFNGLLVYDAETGKIARTIRIPSGDYHFAAGGNTLLVYFVDAALLTSYDLATGEKVKTKASPVSGTITNIVMGRARGDRAFVRWCSGTGALDHADCMLLDATTLAEVPHKQDRETPDRDINAYPIGMHACFRDQVHLRPDGMLSTIGEWCTSGSPNGLDLLRTSGDIITNKYEHTTEGAVQVGDDGRVYTGEGGIFDGELSLKGRIKGQRLFPGIGGILFLGMDASGRLTVYRSGTATPLVSLGQFPDWHESRIGEIGNSRLGPWSPSDFTFDKQVLFDPQHGRLLMIPNSLDKVVQQPFDVRKTLEASGIDYLLVSSRPALTVPSGHSWTYQIQTLSKAGNVTYNLNSGPDGMAVNPTGLVSWKPKSPVGTREDVIISVKDKSGEECFHTFTLWVVDAGHAH